ncbi:MAG: hypothetical protein ACJASY_002910 [Halioglobus sp.]
MCYLFVFCRLKIIGFEKAKLIARRGRYSKQIIAGGWSLAHLKAKFFTRQLESLFKNFGKGTGPFDAVAKKAVVVSSTCTLSDQTDDVFGSHRLVLVRHSKNKLRISRGKRSSM